MKILVTGRHGQLAETLAEQEAKHPNLELSFVSRPEIDLSVRGSASDVILAKRPDLVINAAAFTAVDLAEREPDLAWRINAAAAGEVAAAAHEIGAPIIQVSTDYVFDGRERAPYAESRAPCPINEYGRSKLAGEEEVRAANPNYLIARTAWLFSPFQHNFVRSIVELSRQREILSVVADQHGNPTSASDLADAILHIAEQWAGGQRTGIGETYHIAGSAVASWCDLALGVQAECKNLGFPFAQIRPIATSDWPTAAVRPINSTLDSAKFNRDFNRVMPAWHSSLRPVLARIVRAAS